MVVFGNNNSLDRTLVLAGVCPGTANVGEILLNDMVAFLPSERLVGMAVVPLKEVTAAQESVSPVPQQVLARRFEYGYRPLRGPAGAAVAWAARLATYERHLRRLIPQCVAWGRQHQVQRLWAILDTPTVIEMAYRVAEQLGVPLYSLVWDAPEYLAHLRGLDPASTRRLMRRFALVMRRSQRVAVISETMKERYETDFGTRCVIVRHGLADECRQPAATGFTSDHQMSIGVAGGLYCQSAWQALLEALNQIGWQIAEKRIRLIVLGGELRIRGRCPMDIHYCGFQSVRDTIRTMAQCDLTYLPQPFEPQLRTLAELSFPTKLSTYAAAGRPVLVHCPDYASLTPFIRRHPIGALCTSLEPRQMAEAIGSLARDLDAYRQAAATTVQLAATQFSEETYRQAVKEFLEVERLRGER